MALVLDAVAVADGAERERLLVIMERHEREAVESACLRDGARELLLIDQ